MGRVRGSGRFIRRSGVAVVLLAPALSIFLTATIVFFLPLALRRPPLTLTGPRILWALHFLRECARFLHGLHALLVPRKQPLQRLVDIARASLPRGPRLRLAPDALAH